MSSSWEVNEWASRARTGNPTRKLVLVLLAANASRDDESDRWVTIVGNQRIADEAEMSKRTVIRAIADLEQLGLISRSARHRENGSQTSDRTFLHVVGGDNLSRGEGDTDDNCASSVTPGVMGYLETTSGESQVLFPTPSVTRSLVPHDGNGASGIALGSDRDAFFAEFWTSYPKKAGKGQARKAWATARRRGTDPAVIIAGARRYAADPNREDEYTKHPATWLNGECWDDEPLPARGQRVSNTATGKTSAAFAQFRREAAQLVANAKAKENGNGHALRS
jgi:hypothetical protein